jgi:CoA-transferase family III
VIDVSRAAAGPICGRVLADLGAEVVRVEDPDGEHSRQVGLTFAGNNRNKLSLGLDLTKPEGLDALARITEQSDVVLTNALPAASVRLGIDYATVAACLLNTSAFVQLFGLTDPPPAGGRLDEDRWGYTADQRLYQARDGWIGVAAASPAARQAFAAALALAGCPDAGREVHGLTAAAFAEAPAELDVAAVADLFGRAGFADWTTVRTLEQTARADDDDFIRVAQEPWGFLRQPRLLPRYGLAGQHGALVDSGAMRREPGPVTLRASSV